jgi:hypothetical protein
MGMERKEVKLTQKQFTDIYDAYELMDFDFNDAQEDLEYLIDWLETMPEEIKLYRVIHLFEEDVLDTKRLGDHYSWDKKNLLDAKYMSTGWLDTAEEGKTVLVEVKAQREMISDFDTILNNILYPHEKEVTLKDKGRGVTILDIIDI